MGKQWKQGETLFSWAPKLLQMVTAAMKLKHFLLGREIMTNLLLLLLSCFTRVRLCATPLTAAHQAPLSLGFSRQEYWSGLPFPSPIHACMLSRFSRVRLCATLWTAAHQDPLSMGFSRQEYWNGLPFPSPLLRSGVRNPRLSPKPQCPKLHFILD